LEAGWLLLKVPGQQLDHNSEHSDFLALLWCLVLSLVSSFFIFVYLSGSRHSYCLSQLPALSVLLNFKELLLGDSQTQSQPQCSMSTFNAVNAEWWDWRWASNGASVQTQVCPASFHFFKFYFIFELLFINEPAIF
jgi:hypothetical protein